MKTERVIEAILFATGTYISKDRIAELAEVSSDTVEKHVTKLKEKYSGEDYAFYVAQLGNTYKMTVKDPYVELAEKIAPDTELSKTVIETLAILAWKSPMLQSDLIKIRSSGAYDHIAELKEKGLITKEKYGKTYVLKLTSKFFEYFDISGKDDIESMFDDFAKEHVTPVEQKKVEEYEPKQIELGPSLDEIKQKEREDQKDFMKQLDTGLGEITQKTSQVVDEMKEFTKRDESPTQNDETDESATEQVEDETNDASQDHKTDGQQDNKKNEN